MKKAETIITNEFVADIPGAIEHAKASAFENFKKETGNQPTRYYFTYVKDDFENNNIRMKCFSDSEFYSSERESIIVMAPNEQIKDAVARVMELNAHLVLKEGLTITHHYDEVIINLDVVKLEIMQA